MSAILPMVAYGLAGYIVFKMFTYKTPVQDPSQPFLGYTNQPDYAQKADLRTGSAPVVQSSEGVYSYSADKGGNIYHYDQ